jgi:hypothetical protein
MVIQQKFQLKWWAQITIGALSVAVPLLIWLVDNSSKELEAAIVSSTSLSPDANNYVSGLELSIDGKVLDDPYITVLEILNSGDLPILSSDFEEDLIFNAGNDAQIIRSEVAKVDPASLKPILKVNNNQLLIVPLLLNADDKIRLNILTVGDKPSWTINTRIVGISNVGLTDLSVSNESDRKSMLRGVVGVMLLILYANLMSINIVDFQHKRLKFGVIASAIVCGAAAVMLLEPIRQTIMLGRWETSGIVTLIISFSYLFFRRHTFMKK